MRKGLVLQVYLTLVAAAEVTTNTLTCPPGTTTLITTGDVNEFSVDQALLGGDSFLTVLSSSPNFGDFFVASATPNTGSFKFKERFVLLGFSTTGQEVSGSYWYVSQLSVKTNSSFPENYNYTGEYNVNTFEEVYFPFDEAVLTSEIEFTVMDVVSGSYNLYYWRLRLFGCREVNATQIAAPTMNPSVTVIQSNILSDTSMSPSSSSMKRQGTVTDTETVSSTSSEIVMVERMVSGNSNAGLVGAVVPLLIIILILVTVLIVLLIVIYRKRSDHSRCESLKESVFALHEDLRINKPTDVSIPVNHTREYMMNNDLYLECSVPGEDSLSPNNIDAANLAEIQEGNKSSVDPKYYNIQSNDSTGKNEYEYVRMGEREDGSIFPDIDSKMNPAYSSAFQKAHDYI